MKAQRGELLLEEAPGLLVLELAGLLVELRHAITDEDFRLVDHERIQERHHLAHIVLHNFLQKYHKFFNKEGNIINSF